MRLWPYLSCTKPEEVEIQDNTRGSPVLEIMPAENPKLGFVGAGMMASAMINGIIAAKVQVLYLVSYFVQGIYFLSSIEL